MHVVFLVRIAVVTLGLLMGVSYWLFRSPDHYTAEAMLFGQFVVLACLYILLRNYLAIPLQELIATAKRLQKGDFSLRFTHRPHSYYAAVTATSNQLLDKINNSIEFIHAIESGQLQTEYQLIEGEDATDNKGLAGSLLSMRKQMLKLEQESKERSWGTEGLARFVDILRNNHNSIEALSDQILTTLVKYLGANQGKIFILNDQNDGEVLELASSYAFNRKKYEEQKILPGQGLVGQLYLEKETIYLTDIPQHYVRITSGLGESNPASLILVPLKVNEEVLGVIELASFKTFKKYQIEFLEKLGESIASTISNVKTAERTRLLLAESQQQTEEMRAQEEEMRQNMEELHAIQEQQDRLQQEMKEKVKELEQAQVEMENIKIVEKDRADAQIANRNKLMERAMAKFKQREAELLEEIRLKDEALTNKSSK